MNLAKLNNNLVILVKSVCPQNFNGLENKIVKTDYPLIIYNNK